MNCAWAFNGRVDPRLHDFDDKQAVFGQHAGVDDAAFKIGVALVVERRRNDLPVSV